MTCRERSKSEITRFDRSSEGELKNKYEVVSRQAVADHFLAFRWNRTMSSSPETQTVFECLSLVPTRSSARMSPIARAGEAR